MKTFLALSSLLLAAVVKLDRHRLEGTRRAKRTKWSDLTSVTASRFRPPDGFTAPPLIRPVR